MWSKSLLKGGLAGVLALALVTAAQAETKKKDDDSPPPKAPTRSKSAAPSGATKGGAAVAAPPHTSGGAAAKGASHQGFREHDVRKFSHAELERWRRGRWLQERHDGRYGWWWLVDGAWHFYEQPVYPYPLMVAEVTYVESGELPVMAMSPAPTIAGPPSSVPPQLPVLSMQAASLPSSYTPGAPPVDLAVRPTPEGTVDIWRAQRIANRFLMLRRLASEGLLDAGQYEAWARLNAGAFLLTTAPPPIAGLSYDTPRYEEIVAFLQSLKSLDPRIADAERAAFFQLVMPMDGPKAPPVRPPPDGEAAARWIALLDWVRDAGLVEASAIDQEKAAIEDVRRQTELVAH